MKYRECSRQFFEICPKIPADELPKFCGPDVTDWLVDQITRDLFDINAEGAWSLTIQSRWLEGGGRDLKTLKREDYEKPCGNMCPYTLTLCGQCVKKDVPGNIGAAASLGMKVLRERGEQIAAAGGGREDPYDFTAYRIGNLIHSKFGKGPHFLYPDKIKNLLCERVRDSARNVKPPLPDRRPNKKPKYDASLLDDQNCFPCLEKYSG